MFFFLMDPKNNIQTNQFLSYAFHFIEKCEMHFECTYQTQATPDSLISQYIGY